MYCRYTQFVFDPSDRPEVHRFWHEVGGPVAARQPGFKRGVILDSDESDGVLRALTVWADRSDFDRFARSDDHGPILDGIRATSMTTEARDGLDVVRTVEPVAGEVRVIRAKVREGGLDGLRQFWATTGRRLVESAPGCIEADALVDAEELEAVITFAWRTPQDAEAFRGSAAHNDEFVPGIEEFVTPIARLHTERL